MEKEALTGSTEWRRGTAFFSGHVQVDAAAEVEEDDEFRGGGRAQVCRCAAESGGRREGEGGNGKRAA